MLRYGKEYGREIRYTNAYSARGKLVHFCDNWIRRYISAWQWQAVLLTQETEFLNKYSVKTVQTYVYLLVCIHCNM